MFRTRLVSILLGAAVAIGTMATPASASSVGNQGCTPGYWKNHTHNWPQLISDSGYTATRRLDTVFQVPAGLNLGTPSMATALNYTGGSDTAGAARILLRAATASVLNADHEGVAYPLQRFSGYKIMNTVNSALASGSRSRMLEVARYLDTTNNYGCPLNNTVWKPVSAT